MRVCYKWRKKAKPVTKSRILNHTKLEKYVYTQNIRARFFARGKIYILISSLSLFLLSGDSRKKCVSGEKGKKWERALFTY